MRIQPTRMQYCSDMNILTAHNRLHHASANQPSETRGQRILKGAEDMTMGENALLVEDKVASV
jgi:hypothetical protein